MLCDSYIDHPIELLVCYSLSWQSVLVCGDPQHGLNASPIPRDTKLSCFCNAVDQFLVTLYTLLSCQVNSLDLI
jgi:hypothetical protein